MTLRPWSSLPKRTLPTLHLSRLHVPRLGLLPVTILVMALLIAVKSSILLRAVVATGEAVQSAVVSPAFAAAHGAAKEPTKEPAKAAAGDKSGHGKPDAAAAPPETQKAPEVPPVDAAERAVLLELRQRRETLDARETSLAAREALLNATERKLSTRVEELQALQKKLEALEAARTQREDASWQGLVKLYAAMKPRDAANILNDLDMAVLLQVMDRMKEAKAAPILSAMHPERAREVTDGLARLRVSGASANAPAVRPPPGATPGAPAAAPAGAPPTRG